MPRLEFPLRTNLTLAVEAPTAISFDQREVVWHPPRVSPPPQDPAFVCAPVVTTLTADRDADALAGATAVQSMLSALAFEAVGYVESLQPQFTDEPDPVAPASPCTAHGPLGGPGMRAPTAIQVDPDPRLRSALAWFRAGLNAGGVEALTGAGPFFGFLGFWNALDSAVDGKRKRLDQLIDRHQVDYAGWREGFDGWGHQWNPPVGKISRYMRDDARNAIAHARRLQGRVQLDPDSPPDRQRLQAECWWIRSLARAAIQSEWPVGIQLTY